MREGNDGPWIQVTPSQYAHERQALEYVRKLLPDSGLFRAWANFTFTAQTGHHWEVDLLVAAPGGLYLIEVKSWAGTLTRSGPDWLHVNRGRTRVEKNPLHLANDKAKQLRSLLQNERARQQVKARVPFVQAAVFFSMSNLDVKLSDQHLLGIYGPEGKPGERRQLPRLVSDLLQAPPPYDGARVGADVLEALPGLLKGIGIAKSRRFYQVGSWELQPRPMDVGPTWQDHLAQHRQLGQEKRRIRIYMAERNASEEERSSIERAARREMAALHGISHPGIVQVDTMEPHEIGPALVFRHNQQAKRLDHYMAEHGERLDAATRVGMLRQLAEAVGYAHSRRLFHRALSARSVFVAPGEKDRRDPRDPRDPGDDGWLRPQLQISDWQAAVRAPGTPGAGGNGTRTGTGTGIAGSTPQVTPTSHVVEHLDRAAEAYLAPELTTPEPDPIGLDVFGLGALAYLLLSGQPPAGSRNELQTRLVENRNGLRPSAVADSVSGMMDELVQSATAAEPARRTSSVAEFLEMLQEVEGDLTAPPAPTVELEADPLDARAGDVIGGEWQVLRRLGTGSTSRAFLCEHLPNKHQHVLKIALSDEKATRLEHEARALRSLNAHVVIRLARQDPIQVGNRTVLVLEHAGDTTVARKLRDDGRLTVDELENFSKYLFDAVDYLEGEGVTHRDIKPDNIAIRVRPNRTKQLVLFDFSLAGVPVKDIQAGTPRYLDPFLGSVQRPVYDPHAERYALTVTLHEMASGELPVWGDGATDARLTEGPVNLAVEAFDPAVRDGLRGFFGRALDRDAKRRFESLKAMQDAWLEVFRSADAARPARSEHPDETDETEEAEARDQAAREVTRDTPLDAAGLSPRAVSAGHAAGATTVGDLLAVGAHKVRVQPGVGHKTRRELAERIRQWRDQLGDEEVSPLASAERRAAKAEIEGAEQGAEAAPDQDALARVGLDAVATLLVPKLVSTGRNRSEVEATRLLLGLPDETGTGAGGEPGVGGDAGDRLGTWPLQQQVAEVLGVTAGRVAQILSKQRERWRREAVLCSVHAEVIELLASSGRVMGADEIAAALLARRGSTRTGDLRRAISVAAVRAAVEMDPVDKQSDPRLLTRRQGDRVLVALEVGEDDSPDTPAAFALLDYADALGEIANRLASQEVLPAPATVLQELSEAPPPAGVTLDDRRLVQLAAAAGENAAATARLEIYPLDLDHERALRLTQAGVAPPREVVERSEQEQKASPLPRLRATFRLTPEQVQERVRARFPELPDLPAGSKLTSLLKAAGFDVRWDKDGYVSTSSGRSWSGTAAWSRRSTGRPVSRWTADSPEMAEAMRAEERLASASAGAGSEGGFRALTVHVRMYAGAREELTRRFGVEPVNVTTEFLAAMRELVDARPKPTWETVLAADVAEENSRAALKLREYVERAWELVRPRLAARGTTAARSPVLLHDAAPLARYDAMDLLHELAEAARRGGPPVWVLCPMEDPNQWPSLDGKPVQIQTENERIVLPDAWVANQHRSGDQAS